ncbi:hypothetical protein NCAS_0H02240 [Naumovozyma castellii]|uniref:Rho-GAP domain-containing protein n=1 Tax=Naumovozyma castellii TaxID=27288 RepID=G0VJ55_NAUCA|nr:hypothetical protein NCAS_0H02240 [Naumovozyma castellii CBS 4309]CCC71534.1 hypothetical protein NCAS_0H02240 [Naumovozyma castellii CBS 4309]
MDMTAREDTYTHTYMDGRIHGGPAAHTVYIYKSTNADHTTMSRPIPIRCKTTSNMASAAVIDMENTSNEANGSGSSFQMLGSPNRAHVRDVLATSPAPSSQFKSFRDNFINTQNVFTGDIFGVPLDKSLQHAHAKVVVQTDLLKLGDIPVVVAKCGAYLKAHGLKTNGIFRKAGNNKRVKELQAIFSTPPEYGFEFSDWDNYTIHDVATLLRRYLNNLTEPLISLNLYDAFRKPLKSRPRVLRFLDKQHQLQDGTTTNAELSSIVPSSLSLSLLEKGDIADDDIDMETDEEDRHSMKKIRYKKRVARDIRESLDEYQELFGLLSENSRNLTIYLLDLLSLFARSSELNLMNARNLSAIFQPCLLSHPEHDMEPKEYELSRQVIEFLIVYSFKLLPELLKVKRTTPLSPTHDSTHNKGFLSPITSPVGFGHSLMKIHGSSKNSSSNKVHIVEKKSPSKSMDSSISSTSKKSGKLFPWLHKSAVLSDSIITEGEDDSDLSPRLEEDDPLATHTRSPPHAIAADAKLLSPTKIHKTHSNTDDAEGKRRGSWFAKFRRGSNSSNSK